jgi:hypothetical protein
MSGAKPKLKQMSKGQQVEVLRKNLNLGDVVRIEWLDVHGAERQTVEDIQALTDPEPTRSYGVVVRLMEKSMAVAHELGDRNADGFSVSTYPYGLITAIEVLGHEEIQF